MTRVGRMQYFPPSPRIPDVTRVESTFLSSLEGEAESELAPGRPRNDCRAGRDEAHRVAERGRRPDAVTEVVAVVGAVGQVEGFGNDLHVGPFSEFEGLSEAGIQLEEGIAAHRIVGNDGAACRRTQAV